jgi:cell division protein FtsB
MKKRRSFFKRHIILISILILASVYSLVEVTRKEIKKSELEEQSLVYQSRIEDLEDQLTDLQAKESEHGTLEFVERYARERFKMVKPDEIYFQMQKGKDKTE